LIRRGAENRATASATAAVAVLAALALPAFSGPAAARSTEAPEARPNIIMIQVDDAVVGDLRFMPTVKRQLIRRGTDFTAFFNSYPLCCPARTTLMTGQFSHNHGVLSNFKSNDGGYYTFSSLPGKLNQRNSLAPWLHRAGYRTAMVGKYLNEYGALDRREVPPGWDQWAVLLDNSTYDYFNYAMNVNGKVRFWGDRRYAKQQLKLARLGATDPPESFAELLATFQKAFVPYDSFGSQRPRDYTMDTNGRYAARFVRRAAPSRRPFFLYYAPPGPHAEDTNHAQGLRPGAPEPDPRPPYRYRDTFDDVPLPKPPSFNEADVSDKAANIRSLPKLTKEQIAEIADNYRGRLGAVRAVDDQVGRILRQLRRAGELRNTYIIFNSDNGYLQGEHRLRSSKYLPFEGAIRVPTVIRGPAVQRGERIGRNAIDVDLAPTILDIANVRPGRLMDGVSLLPAARGSDRLPQRDVPLEALRPLFRFFTPITAFDLPYYGVRTSRYKYIRWSFGESELYDLRDDPDELVNLAGDPAYAALSAQLEARAAELRGCKGAACR
jgi:N-acetylglucosamine-6-sulfatase